MAAPIDDLFQRLNFIDTQYNEKYKDFLQSTSDEKVPEYTKKIYAILILPTMKMIGELKISPIMDYELLSKVKSNVKFLESYFKNEFQINADNCKRLFLDCLDELFIFDVIMPKSEMETACKQITPEDPLESDIQKNLIEKYPQISVNIEIAKRVLCKFTDRNDIDSYIAARKAIKFIRRLRKYIGKIADLYRPVPFLHKQVQAKYPERKHLEKLFKPIISPKYVRTRKEIKYLNNFNEYRKNLSFVNYIVLITIVVVIILIFLHMRSRSNQKIAKAAEIKHTKQSIISEQNAEVIRGIQDKFADDISNNLLPMTKYGDTELLSALMINK